MPTFTNQATLSYNNITTNSNVVTGVRYFGMNPIAAYVIAHVCDFSSLTGGVLFGLEHLTGNFYPVILVFAKVSILFLIMRYLYNKKIFLKV